MKKILLLQDDANTVAIVEEILSYEHYEVKTAAKMEGFTDLAERFGPDLILLDYTLTDGNGGELCRAMKTGRSSSSVSPYRP